jgi:hypothetical protein
MTRASLLHILDHVSEISDAEIRELEQLAAAFPYCQTAHILLAKAAHDRGSMLASQRLRRAATYATNRELLRHLLEHPAPAPTAEPRTLTPPEVLPPLPAPVVDAAVEVAVAGEPSVTTLDESAGKIAEVEELASAPQEEIIALDTPEAIEHSATIIAVPTAELPASFEPTTAVAAQALDSGPLTGEKLLSSSEDEQTSTLSGASTLLSEEVNTLQQDAASDVETDHQLQPEPLTEIFGTDESFADLAQRASASGTPAEASETEVAPSFAAETETSVLTLTGLAETPAADASVEALVDDLLPPIAPPIRPPANAGISRFEFDLVEPALPAPSAYRLPGLEDESEEEDYPLPTISKTGLPAFHADETLGYALGGGSRLGYELQPHDGYTLDLPLDSFFEPDALLLAHIAANQARPAKSSIDLINRFLKAQPRIKPPANDVKPADEQADLSVRSTQAAPAVASESLAKIMVKQGKIDKAIEIYERLMQRQPEKKAYFADQIQQLKQPSA